MWYALNSNPTDTIVQCIGCSSKFFQDWIFWQMNESMTMDNYGSYWEIDHVKPCSSFDLSWQDQLDECFNWKNLRPYESSKNKEKGSKIDKFAFVLQDLKVKCFEKYY